MTILLEHTDQMRWQTDLGKLLLPIRLQVEELNWLVSDLDWRFIDDKEPQDTLAWCTDSSFTTASGKELYQAVDGRDVQIVWGVFCGVRGNIPDLLEGEVPYADGNAQLWSEPKAFQLASSEIEIVCFDSTCTLVKFRDERIGWQFLEVFSEGKIL